MANTKALARPIIVTMPRRSPGRLRRASRRVVAGAGRRLRAHGKRALPVGGIALGALVVGYAQSKGFLDKLPQIAGSKTVTLGVLGYFAATRTHSSMLREAGVAALAAAAFDFGRVQGGGTSGMDYDGGAGPHAGY